MSENNGTRDFVELEKAALMRQLLYPGRSWVVLGRNDMKSKYSPVSDNRREPYNYNEFIPLLWRFCITFAKDM
jgi:hypothetical protein